MSGYIGFLNQGNLPEVLHPRNVNILMFIVSIKMASNREWNIKQIQEPTWIIR